MGTLRDTILIPLDAVLGALRRQSIVFKLTLFVGLLVALTAGALITAGYLYTSAILRDEINNRLSAMADDRRAILLTGVAHLEERIRTLTSRYRLRETLEVYATRAGASGGDPSRAVSSFSLEEVRADTEGLLALWIEDLGGRIIESSGPRDMIDLFPRASRFSAAAPNDLALVCLPRSTGGTTAALFRAAARSRTRGLVGSYLALMDLGPIVAGLSDPRHLGDSGEILVGVRDQENVRYLFPPRLTPDEVEFPVSRTPAMARAVAGESGFMATVDRMGRDVLVAFLPVGYENWGLVAKMDASEAYAPVRRLRRLLMAIGGLILALGLAASYMIARQNTRPIRRLAATADAIARGDLNATIDVRPGDEISTLGQAFRRMSDEVSRSHADLEHRIAERTRDLEAIRDLLDAFFRIFTSRLDPQNIDKTFDSVLRFCHQLGYDLAMISLVDREAGVVRGARGSGTMSDVVDQTVRPLDGDDILALVAREGRTVVIPDSTADPRCDQPAVALARIHGQIILPLVGDTILGTLQVATPEVLDLEGVDLRPLESLASHTARALEGLRQVEEIGRLNRSLEEQASELKKSASALREQTRILQSVLDCMREGVVVANRESRLLVFNPAAGRILGRDSGHAALDRWDPLYQVYRPDRTTPYAGEELPLYRAIRGESVDQAELYIAHPSLQDGSWMLVNARPLRDDHGEIQGGLVVFHDITKRKNDERRLAAQYAATRVLAESDSLDEINPAILEIIGGLDWDFAAFWRVESGHQQVRCVTLWHAPGCAFTEFEQATRTFAFAAGAGLPGRVWSSRAAAWIAEIGADPNFPRAAAAAADGLRSGFAVPILVRGECLGILEFFSREPRSPDPDLMEMATNLGRQIGQFIERHQMHSRMVQSEKLAALGMLSAGVAHEINNPLAYIANNLAVLERDLGSILALVATYEKTRDILAAHSPEVLAEIERLNEECDFAYIQANLDKILGSTRQGVKRVAEIVQNLRGFTRLDRAAVDRIDIHEALGSALEMIRGRLQRRRITVEEHHGELPPVAASHVQINQVFLNLLVNAMQAIESAHRDDGRIVTRTHAEGNQVTIEIADNGCGIPPDVLPHIFDPFFTTKGVGDGTGLGLSITHGIVQDHSGRMEVESTPGQGTCFRIILPVSRR